jgi:hypothetical protein
MVTRFSTLLLIICLAAGSADASPRHFGGTAAPQSAGTVFASTDCSPAINITNGGLTLTATANGNPQSCRASNPKFSGLWYFEATPTSIGSGSSLSIGVVNGAVGAPVTGLAPAWSPASPQDMIGLDSTGAGLNNNGTLLWNSGSTPLGSGLAASTTAAVAVDLDTDPAQIWVTPNVADLVCNGNGGTGSTAPQWNGNCTNDPSLMGTGVPVDGTGRQFFLPGYGIAPGYDSYYNATNPVTFNFGASAFAGTVPPGYSPWNASGGAAADPGPNHPMTINVANAPGWQANHSYVAGDRVVAGPGWNAGSPGSFTSGQALYLFATTTASGTSASSGNGPQSCPSPANVGGGLVNPTSAPSGWASATHVTDGGVTWVCLTPVDYVTLTGAFGDSAVVWASGQQYGFDQWVVFGGQSYRMDTPETSSPYTCTSDGSAPSNDTGCSWEGHGAITYSSMAHQWPHELYPSGSGGIGEIQFDYQTNLTLWYGGAAQTEYLSGSNGESDPIVMEFHSDYIDEAEIECYKATGLGVHPSQGCGVPTNFVMNAAPGDSFQDNITAASGPLRPDPTKGVMLDSTSPWVCATPYTGVPLGVSDSFGTIERVQAESSNSGVFLGHGSGPGNDHTNDISILDDILYSVGGTDGTCGRGMTGGSVVASGDSGWVFGNDVIIQGGCGPGAGINTGFSGVIYNNTLIGPGSGCSTGTAITEYSTSNTSYGQETVYNNVFVGFMNPAAGGTGVIWPPTGIESGYNATDIGSSYTGGTTFYLADGNNYTTEPMPGVGSTCQPSGTSSCYGLSPADQFVDPMIGSSLDLRIIGSSAGIYGAGDDFSIGGVSPGSDILGTARPQSGRIDIGAFECPTGSCP